MRFLNPRLQRHEPLLDPGTLVEFRLHGERHLGIADRPHGKKHWVVVDEDGQAHTIHPRQVTHEVSGKGFAPAGIATFLREVEPHLDPSSLEVAWEYLVDEGVSIDLPELAELLFSASDPPALYAAHCLLFDDNLYFKQKGERFEPRSRSQVEDLRHQIEVTRQRQTALEAFQARVARRIEGPGDKWAEEDLARLQALERFVEQEGASPDRAAALDTLAALDRPKTPEAAFALLVQIGRWHRHENLYLRRSRFSREYSVEAREAATRALGAPPADPDDPQRLDLTRHKVYTIDDTSTHEIDDGLSVERLEDRRTRIWIHIADPTRLLDPGDPLDREARARATTLYLPEGMISMFPRTLATGPMSLVRGEACPALSFGVVLNPEGSIDDYVIHTTQIRPLYRLTYAEVDTMLASANGSEPELELIRQCAELRQRWRKEQGAVSISMPEASIAVHDDEIAVKRIDDSPARTLVSEMMILAGQVAAVYGIRNSIPLPYRFQAEPNLPPPEELRALPEGPVRDSAIRRCMPRTGMGTTPQRHAGLGLDAYVQASSPIRRYMDLLAHFQIKAHLRGEPPLFDPQALGTLIQDAASLSLEAGRLERQTKHYWTLEYLRRNVDRQWDVLVLRWIRKDEGIALILLEELGVELSTQIKLAVRPGQRLRLALAYADPRKDKVRFKIPGAGSA
jgi:exoribonuclease-2